MRVRRDDYKQVKPTEEELELFFKKHPHNRRPHDHPMRAEHLPCGTRIWYVGIAIGSHERACPARSPEWRGRPSAASESAG